MNTRAKKIAKELHDLGGARLNDAEQLRLAELLVQDVFSRVCPLMDPQMCTAEGYLASAAHALEQARLLVESWPHDNLPVDPDMEPENKRETGPATCGRCGYELTEYECTPQKCRRHLIDDEMPARTGNAVRSMDDVLVQLRACLSDGRVLMENVGSSRAGVRISNPDALRSAFYFEAHVLVPGRR